MHLLDLFHKGRRPARRSGTSQITRRQPRLEALEDRLLMHGGPVAEMVAAGAGAAAAGAFGGAKHPLTDLPALHSNSGAPATLYLDFDGHFESQFGGTRIFGIQFGGYSNVRTPVFDLDGDASTFSDGELAAIREIHQRVAEDFAPFNIDVTTINPGNFANGKGLRAAIGGSQRDWYNPDGKKQAAGGISYVDSFTSDDVNTVYAWVDAMSPAFIADTVSHEAGHAFGLQHQSSYDAAGTKTEYNTNGNSNLKAPIMGDPQRAARSLWWRGPNSEGRNNIQDDIAVISRPANGFGFRADDHGDSAATATQMTFASQQWNGSGIIGQTSDVDFFTFEAEGLISAKASVIDKGPNLDVRLELRDQAGNVIASSDPANSLNAEIRTNVARGRYFLVVASHGDYGDLGQYTVAVKELSGARIISTSHTRRWAASTWPMVNTVTSI
jgi:hypothetical protein